MQTNTFLSPQGNTRMYNTTYLVLHIYRSQAESQFGEALSKHRKESFNKTTEMRHFGAWWCSVKSNGLFTHRLPRSTLLHWLLIYIFWFIEAHASYFNQGSPYQAPLIPSISLTAILFSPTMHINSKKYNQFYDRLRFLAHDGWI